MQYMGSGKVSMELRHGYDHFVFLEKKTEQLNQKLQGYARKCWTEDFRII